MVSVVIISTALSAEILNAHINGLQDSNEEEYFRAISEYILTNCGTPADWGSNNTSVPETLGLAKDSLRPNELDIDKICRLNSQNAFALTYPDILNAAKLKNVALGVSLSQLMNISVIPSSKSTLGDSTTYTFMVSVSQDGAPVVASLHYYIVAKDFLSDLYNRTSIDGISYIDVELPNTSNGTASLVTFARAMHDPRMTAYSVYSFGHLFTEPWPNNMFLDLSPLNYTLSVSSNRSDIVLERSYAFTYSYQFNLTSTSNTTYAIPAILERSPIALVICGSNASTFFIEWTAYPQIPLETGADFQNSECYSFSYIVTIKATLYKFTLRFGGMNP
jgi:hypothetical protein